MTDWNEEDEFEKDEGLAIPEPVTEEEGVMPQGVMDRIKAQAERTKKSEEEVLKEYLEFIAKEFGCDDPYSEDEDLLIDWSESAFVTMRRSGSGAGGGTTAFVGCFVGVGEKWADRMENLRKRNIADFTKDPAQIIESGRLGVYEDHDGLWGLNTCDGLSMTEHTCDETPPFGFKADGKWVAFVSKVGKRPYPSFRKGRYLYFLGNEESQFVNDANIELWRVDATDEASDMMPHIGRPVRIMVRPPRDTAPDSMKDVLGTNSNFEETLEYTDEFVDADNRPLLQPNNLWLNDDYHDLFIPIDELSEAFDAKSRMIEFADGRKVKAGPLIITKGTVSRMSTEQRESQYDQEGYNFSMAITNTGLGEEIMCWIPGAVGNLANPFMAGWGDDAVPYAERSSVLVFGRLKMRVKDGNSSPQINVFGVFVHPRRARRRMTGGDTSVDQFKESDE